MINNTWNGVGSVAAFSLFFCRPTFLTYVNYYSVFTWNTFVNQYRCKDRKGDRMEKEQLIKNISFSQPLNILGLVDYEEGRVVSRTLASKSAVGITLFAFDKGEGISAHSASGDAMVQILDGEALITIGEKEITASAGQVVVMPADVPHALQAVSRFKMILTVVKREAAQLTV